MDARAPITLSISPLLISSSEPDFGWLRDKLAAAGWNERQAREVRGSLAISMRIAAPPPPAGLSGRKAAILIIRRAGSFGALRVSLRMWSPLF